MRSRIDTRTCSTQSSPISTCRPITTCACTTDRAPMRVPSPMTANGPTDTPSPSVTSCPIAAVACTPGGGRQGSAKSSTARANARYGCRLRSIAHEAAFGRLGEDDGRGASRAQRGGVLGVGEEGQIAWDRIIDPGDAADVDVRIAFEAALEARRNVLKFQGPVSISYGLGSGFRGSGFRVQGSGFKAQGSQATPRAPNHER